MSDSLLSRPGADLAWDASGTGPVVGYSHGLFQSRAAEDSLGLLDWSPLTRERRLVRYDARGHGRSTGEPDEGHYRWPFLAGDLIAMADEVRGGEPVDWIGESMGAGALLWAATRSPARFRRLVLMIPPTTGETRVAATAGYGAAAAEVEKIGKAAWMGGAEEDPGPEIFAGLTGYGAGIDVSEALLPSALRGAAGTDLPPREAIAALTHPTLVLAWETDPTHPVSTADYLAETLPDARRHVSATVADIRTWPSRIVEFLRL
jgi:pimeloyl-ACP methyl ester carboxylesterase